MIVLRDHAAGDGKNSSKEGDVKQNGSVGRDFKVKDKIRVQDGCKKKNSSEGASDEGDESDRCRRKRVRKVLE